MAETKRKRSFYGIVALVVYGVVCLALFLYLRFPYDILKDTLEDSLSSAFGRDVSIGHVHPGLPFSLAVDGLRIDAVPVLDRIIVRPAMMGLLAGSVSLDLKANLPSGSGTGTVKTPIVGFGQTMKATLNVEDVDLAKLSGLLPPEYQPRGIITGSADIQTTTNSFERATGDIAFLWKQGGLPISIPAVPLSEIGFEVLDVQARFDRGVLSLEKAEMTGEISGSMKGALQITQNLSRSRINFSGEVMLPESMMNLLGTRRTSTGGPVRFSLRGSLDRPLFRLLSR
ncbi:MAG TPA: type II secretion system protein GspN [Deltaproteobacteria bacterium]|nr:type II secretion system protein GspN [Deltaproteobacteria bacterium]